MIDNPSGYDRETILTFPCDTNPFVARTEYRSPIPSFSCWCFGKNPEQKILLLTQSQKVYHQVSLNVIICHGWYLDERARPEILVSYARLQLEFIN